MHCSWLILIVSLPTRNSTGRMRVWRALKALGCGVLRDGVYLLPSRSEFRQVLKMQAQEVVAGGGSAHVLVLDSENQDQQKSFEALFDRSTDYAKLMESIRQTTNQDLSMGEPAKLQRLMNRLRKALKTIEDLDYFPGAAREQAIGALEDLEHSLSDRWMPDEHHEVHRRIKRLNSKEYQGRMWASVQRPGIDGLASAWLITRFIDPTARFMWLSSSTDCPADVIGFDFDDATFTHVGTKVTFEVLLASFGLTQDTGLHRLGGLVHYLDVGGIPVAESAGLETLVRGMHQQLTDDDALLTEATKAFDSFYRVFSNEDTKYTMTNSLTISP